MNIESSVKLEVVVAPDGSMKSMSAKGGHPLLPQRKVRFDSGDGNLPPTNLWIGRSQIQSATTGHYV